MIDRFLTRIANAHSFLSKLWVLARPYWFAEERQAIGLWGYSVMVKEVVDCPRACSLSSSA